MASDLKTFIKNNTKFLRFEDGDVGVFVYRGYKVYPSRFDSDKEVVGYKLEDPETKKVITWENGSTKVANLMIQFKEGDQIKIVREGSGTKDTKYTIILCDGVE